MSESACSSGACGDRNVEMLNEDCFCLSMNTASLRKALEFELGTPELFELISERCPFMFSATPVFVSAEHLRRMAEVIAAVEAVIALPRWRSLVLQSAPEIARHAPGASGVFFGYDFHVNDTNLGLIEINTNAGGAILNVVLARAQLACCAETEMGLPAALSAQQLEEAIIAMFRNEWTRAGRPGELQTIAIIDEAPAAQYLYPEFLLFADLFRRHGFDAVIAAPEECQLRNGALWYDDLRIDLVYNRLTDFLLEQPANAHLKEAYLADAAVITPHPRAHALYANKRNLALLGDAATLDELGVPAATRDILLAGIPRTEIVQAADADRLWRERKQLFFKPASGYGSRAAWRGDKVTKRVWQEILDGDYVAQALVQPGRRRISATTETQVLKFDLRNYAYQGAVQWTAARLYQGQTTNFRTEGGGFAPVYHIPAAHAQIGEPSSASRS